MSKQSPSKPHLTLVSTFRQWAARSCRGRNEQNYACVFLWGRVFFLFLFFLGGGFRRRSPGSQGQSVWSVGDFGRMGRYVGGSGTKGSMLKAQVVPGDRNPGHCRLLELRRGTCNQLACAVRPLPEL